MQRRRLVGVLAATVLVLSACGGASDGAADVDASVPSAPDVVASASDEAPGTAAAPTQTTGATTSPEIQMFPDVIGAELTANGDTWTVAATLSSPYDTPERYADAFRIMAPDGTVLGERILGHDHASEQPFTRSESGVEIPDGVDRLTIEGRDLEFGYGGATYQVDVPR